MKKSVHTHFFMHGWLIYFCRCVCVHACVWVGGFGVCVCVHSKEEGKRGGGGGQLSPPDP